KTRQQQKGIQNQYTKLSSKSQKKIISENNLFFELNLTDYLDTGLFLDHRNTRALCQELSNQKRVLNLFAYTGSFTCYAINGGATATTTVDLNPNYIEWTKKNIQLNKFNNRKSDRFIVDNVLRFLQLEKSKNTYDLIICDPPTFSNSKNMQQTFAINQDYPELIAHCLTLLSPKGKLLFSTNSKSFNLDPKKLPNNVHINNISKQTIPLDFKDKKPHQAFLIQQ
ncbi:hypothetical protein DID76_03370, partial [Candidatus Marinamargulisbacteria bacterium SCGC AG-414-C22]